MHSPRDKHKGTGLPDSRLLETCHAEELPGHSPSKLPRRRLKASLVGITATGIVMGLTVPAAFAATGVTWSQKNIDFSTYAASGVSGYTASGTTYMPIWYVMQALKKSGYGVSFNGRVLNLTPPQGTTPNTAGLTVGSGNFSIEINGQSVKNIDSQVRNDPASGKPTQYIPIYYIQQILSALSFYNAWDGTNWTGRPVDVTMLGTQTVTEGQMDAFALELQNPDGSFFIPNHSVTWSVNGAGEAQIGKNTGIFTATSPGIYDVTGSVDSFHWTEAVQVSGQAVGVQLSASTTKLMADGTTTSAITVRAVDAAGNLVTNFNGSVQLNIPVAGGSFVGGITSGTVNQIPVYLYNGVGTATLTAPLDSPQISEPLTAASLTSASQSLPANVQYGSLNISYQTPVISQIGISPSTTTLDSNSNNSSNLTLTLEDQQGNVVTNGPFAGVNVTLTISGPASFATGVSETTTTAYVFPGSTGVTVPIYAIAGQSGSVTVTASGAGVSGTTVLSSNPSQSSRSLTVSQAHGTLTSDLTDGSITIPAGTPFTLYTATVIDGNGNPLPQADTLWISDSTTASATSGQTTPSDELTYFGVAGGQPSQLLQAAGTNLYSIATSGATGKAQFIVFNTGNAPASTSINIRDLTTNATVTMTSGSN